tara:strand:+ start:491 stop:865 length:375 start_codon:yes stop_codon:yes gene_type:complete
MATVKSTLKLTSTDLTTDSLDVTVLNTLTSIVTGGLHRRKLWGTATGSQEELAEETHYAGSAYVYVKNCQSGTTDNVYLEIGGADNMVLAPGEWAWFPWSAAGDDINAYATTQGSIIEYGIFGA